MVTVADVERFVSSLPETTSSPSYGFPGLKVNQKLFARLRGEMLDESDPASGAPYGEILMVTLADLGEKEALLADDPDVYFTVPHYEGYAAILVRLTRVDEEELHELLSGSLVEEGTQTSDQGVRRPGRRASGLTGCLSDAHPPGARPPRSRQCSSTWRRPAACRRR